MPTDWRALFNEVGIYWTDRGSNSILGQPTIRCPLCGTADPSQHLNFGDEGYYCQRDRSHGGRNFPQILRALLPTRSREDIVALLNRHNTLTANARRSRPIQHVPSEVERLWSRFRPASEHDAYLEYLYGRGFDDPESVCRKYDLRYAPFGRWSARLLIPLTDDDGSIVSWTGRAITDIQPRYDTLPVGRSDLLCMPRMMRANAFLIEGPMDVLKVAEATDLLPITPIGLLGTGTSMDRVMRVARLVRNCRNIIVTLDDGEVYDRNQRIAVHYGISPIATGGYRAILFSLASLCTKAYIRRLPLPRGYKDYGEMPHAEIVSQIAASYKSSFRGNNDAKINWLKTSSEVLAGR